MVAVRRRVSAVVLRLKFVSEQSLLSLKYLCEALLRDVDSPIALWDSGDDFVDFIVETSLARRCIDECWRWSDSRLGRDSNCRWSFEPMESTRKLSFQRRSFVLANGDFIVGYLQWIRHSGEIEYVHPVATEYACTEWKTDSYFRMKGISALKDDTFERECEYSAKKLVRFAEMWGMECASCIVRIESCRFEDMFPPLLDNPWVPFPNRNLEHVISAIQQRKPKGGISFRCDTVDRRDAPRW